MSNLMQVTLTVPSSQLSSQVMQSACQISVSYSITPYVPPWDHTKCNITEGWVKFGDLNSVKSKLKGHEMHNEGLYAVTWKNDGQSPFHAGALYIGQTQQTVYKRLNEFEDSFRGKKNNHNQRISANRAEWEKENNKILGHEDLTVWYRLHTTDGPYPRLLPEQSKILECMAFNAHTIMQQCYPKWNIQSLLDEKNMNLVLGQLTKAGWV